MSKYPKYLDKTDIQHINLLKKHQKILERTMKKLIDEHKKISQILGEEYGV